MTSQVAVANHSGIAVASDTVTTTFYDGGAKTVGNKKKIMEIGKEHRVLVLTSGSVVQNGVTLTLLINEWSSTLGKPLSTLEDYVDSFIAWMSKERNIHTVQSEYNRARSLLNDHFTEVKKRSESHWYQIPVEEEHLTSREEILLTFATEGLEYLKGLPFNPGIINDNEFLGVINHEEIDLGEMLEYFFQDIGLDDINRAKLIESAPLVLSRAQEFPGSSTFAFVGFGSQEYFAGNIRLRSKGFYGGKFIHDRGTRFSVNPENGATISAFAQDDAIFGFIRGIRHEVLTHAWEQIDAKINEYFEVSENEDLGQKIADEVCESIRNYCFNRMTSPLLDSIEGLDLGHLANLAESLVGMEATSAFGAEGPATVGGFIEVATIDRQFGVRWVKAL